MHEHLTGEQKQYYRDECGTKQFDRVKFVKGTENTEDVVLRFEPILLNPMFKHLCSKTLKLLLSSKYWGGSINLIAGKYFLILLAFHSFLIIYLLVVILDSFTNIWLGVDKKSFWGFVICILI